MIIVSKYKTVTMIEPPTVDLVFFFFFFFFVFFFVFFYGQRAYRLSYDPIHLQEVAINV